MNKTRRHILAAIATLALTPAMAQQDGADDALRRAQDEVDSLRQTLDRQTGLTAQARRKALSVISGDKLATLLSLDAERTAILAETDALVRQTDSLRAAINALEGEVSQYDKEVSELDQLKATTAGSFVSDNTPVLQQPFTKLTASQLQAIAGESRRLGVETEDPEFARLLKAVTANKATYDLAAAALDQPHTPADIDKLAKKLREMTTPSSQPQKAEADTLTAALTRYKKGLDAFLLIISKYDNYRKDGIVSPGEGGSQEVLDFIIQRNILAARVQSEINGTPFLKRKYAEYRKQLCSRPTAKSAVEDEIKKLAQQPEN